MTQLTRTLFVSLALIAGAALVGLAPTSSAMAECDFRAPPCPGVICIGQGADHGYKACVGGPYCDPAACDPFLPLP